MTENSLLDYEFIEITNDLTFKNIKRLLRSYKIKKDISPDLLIENVKAGKTQVMLTKITFTNFIAEYEKSDIDEVYKQFINAGLRLTKKQIVETYNEVKDKEFDYYLFFE